VPSVQHQLLTRLIPLVRRSGDVRDAEALRQAVIASRPSDPPTPPTRLLRGFTVTRIEGYGFPVFSLHLSGTSPQRTVVYLHGGGYVGDVDRLHWRYVAAVARRLGVRVVLPAYPLAPEHTWRDAHPPLLSLCEQVAIESPHGIVLMGDSAGGGLALALAQQLVRRPGPQPTRVVLLSPWVDLTGTTPGTPEASARDPWLRLSKMQLYASWWADGDLAAPEVSPLSGELAGLPPVMVFSGTRDTLWPQAAEFVRRAEAAGVTVTYREEPDLLHVYPILPIPEAKRALDELVSWLR
jgi:monoterpene epsilon-lactone hydrolase